uniref:NADH-ubiquinone oxidoreductase chain 2 n=1 Tax=Auriculastra duplicata TaxID=1628032 RepID=A0A343SWH3_9EUPU|nr:NADH dehydrogenase subunit 2 [Auriculastra duplicata]AUT77323.1 NADH dehydrogenase subunit 2 [Auriculastra duplicata]
MGASNLLFSFFLVGGPLLSLSSSNWALCWAGMEVGFLGLLPLLFLGGASTSKESALKYFVIQALASALLFLTGAMVFFFQEESVWYVLGFLAAIVLKLGVFPGHFWVTSVVFGLEWVSCCLILGPLKLPPLGFLSVFGEQQGLWQTGLLILAGVSAIVGAMLGNNQTNVRAMIGASSITHTSWLVLGAVVGGLWVYLGLYLVILFLALLFMWEGDDLGGALTVLSMSGLPPFIMFVAKFTVVSNLLFQPSLILYIVLPLASAVLSLVFYLKFSYSFYLKVKNVPAKSSLFLLTVLNLTGVVWLIIFFGGRDKAVDF